MLALLMQKISYEIHFGKHEREGNLVVYSSRWPTTLIGVVSKCTQEVSFSRSFIPKLKMVATGNFKFLCLSCPAHRSPVNKILAITSKKQQTLQ